MTGLGSEHPQQNSRNIANSESGGAESGARPDLSPNIAPELAGLIDAWASLPEPVRRGILAMVEAAKGEDG
jgi:hypothetical protein